VVSEVLVVLEVVPAEVVLAGDLEKLVVDAVLEESVVAMVLEGLAVVAAAAGVVAGLLSLLLLASPLLPVLVWPLQSVWLLLWLLWLLHLLPFWLLQWRAQLLLHAVGIFYLLVSGFGPCSS